MDLHLKWIIFLCVLPVGLFMDGINLKHMNHFIKVVETIETENPGLGPLAVLRGLREAAGINTPFIQHYLGPFRSHAKSLVINPALTGYLSKILQHKVKRDVEEGVVLTADGTTVALAPLLLGLEAGFTGTVTRVRGLYPLSLTQNLALSFLQQSERRSSTSPRLGPGGCWDSVTNPQVFTLSGEESLATEALINGGMDGVILGRHMAKPNNRLGKLSSLLKKYYNHQLDGAGLDAAPTLISQLRRSTFRKLVSFPLLKKQLERSLTVYQKWNKDLKKIQNKAEILNEGLKEFFQSFVDCPAIIPRCMWEAQPYRGTPTLLSLPLSFLYIHHTYEPSQPCLSFQQCSQDMRAMQRFHQNDRGWDDIGYSFVAGSDGYLYEGRGWLWQGAHTKGYNSKAYGVSFIGDYMNNIPSERTMDLVKTHLAKCAIDKGKLVSNYIIHGHRQLVNTSCPGDAFYNEIKGWQHFGEVKH
ncbi:peptidoglycan recognition protein 6 [Trichomycterus rosablanca]|uniref:peptidoglycan recognition protein 6 n=1 Tax=Trichomycterus rosablanca TaxID=2290929 RepID=UPI002F357B37